MCYSAIQDAKNCPGKTTSTASFGNFDTNDFQCQLVPGFKSSLLDGSLVERKLGNLAKKNRDRIDDLELRAPKSRNRAG